MTIGQDTQIPRTDVAVHDQPQHIDPEFTAESKSELTEAIRRLARATEGSTRFVDEYVTQGPVPVSVTSLQVQPQFELYAERIKRVLVIGPTATTLGPSTNQGAVTDPGAGANIVSLGVLPAGQYQAYVTVGLEGTVAAGDADNMKAVNGANTLEHFSFPGVVGEYPQDTFQFTSDGATATQIKAVAAASGAAAIYDATFSVIPINVAIPFTLQLGDRYWQLTLPSTGILEFSCDLLLTRTDVRKLTSATAGAWFFELTGEADARNRY